MRRRGARAARREHWREIGLGWSFRPTAGPMTTSLVAPVGYSTLDTPTFHQRLTSGFFGVLIDTRDQNEWNGGHIPNATFLINLHATEDTAPIAGCQSCNVGVYCHSGYRKPRRTACAHSI